MQATLAPIAAQAETPPWAVGVTEVQKARAEKLLEAGNALFLDKSYAEALARYTEAVAAWNHPAIRFNMVRCLIQLERPVEASDNLKQALAYGAAPLEATVYSEALSYEKLLASQIAEVSLSCRQAGVTVTLDGKPLAICPASEVRRVAPGTHQVVGSKPGYLTRVVEVVVIGGKTQQVGLELDPVSKAARIEHRWPAWVPWVVFGAGAAVVGAGALVDREAQAKFDTFDRSVQQNCLTPCTEEELAPFVSYRDDGERQHAIALGVVGVGAATVATGAVLLYLNRGRTVYPSSKERITPALGPVAGGAALGLRGSF